MRLWPFNRAVVVAWLTLPAARLRVILIVLASSMLASAAVAQDVPQLEEVDHVVIESSVKPDPSNAATWYLRAAAKYRAVRHSNEQEFAVAAFEGDPSRGATPQVQQILRRYQPAIMLTRRAVRREPCDFSVGVSPSSAASLLRLGQARSLSRLLRIDFNQRVFENDTRGATESLVAWYRMAGHFAHEDTLIGSAVATAMLALADTQTQVALDHAIINPAEAMLLLSEMDRFDAEDPARYHIAARTEMIERVEPLLASFTGDGGLDRLREYWGAIDAYPTPEMTDALRDSTQEQLDAMLERLSDATRRALAALDEPNPDTALERATAIQEEIEEGRLGPFAQMLLGYRANAPQMVQWARKALAERRAIIAGIADGTIDSMSLANAAVWCIRATLQMENIDPVKVQAIDAYATKHDQPADAALTTIFNRFDVQSVVDTLRTAATINRCDFSYANYASSPTFGSYHAGMLSCGRLLVADAARLFHEQRYSESAERLAIAYRLSAFLATDGHVAGSLAAHRMFVDADALAEAALDSRMLSEDHIALLAEAVRTISRGDPFHYQPAIAGMRGDLDYTMTYFVQGLPKNPHEPKIEERELAGCILTSLSPDQLLSLAITCQYWEKAYYQIGRGEPGLLAAGLEAIYDMTAFADCADLAPFLTEWSKTGFMENVQTAEFPVIAPLEERARQSIIDYRRCVLRMNRLLPEQGAIGVQQASESTAN